MKREKKSIICLLYIALFGLFCFGQPLFAEETQDPVHITLIAEEQTIQPGRPFWVALRLQLADHWHSYWKNPGDSGMPTAIHWDLPKGVTAEPIEWPYPQRFDLDSLIGYGYEGEVWLLTKITPDATLTADREATLKASVRWLVCNDSMCLPGTTDVSLQLPVQLSSPQPNQQWSAAFEQARSKLPKREWSVHAEQSGALIQLTLAVPASNSQQNFQQAHFIPEEQQMVDPQVAATLSASSEPGHYVVALTSHEAATLDQVKGVLLLEHAQGKEAIAIDAPIKASNEIALADSPVADIPVEATNSSQFEGGLGVALILAFIGGMILNLMPCVLPVMSFKILSFVKMAGQCRAKTIQHGIVFSIGVIVSFWVLAGMLLMLQAYGHSVGWGFQLQDPLFVALLAVVLLIFGLSLFGVFEIGTSLIGVASDAQQRSSGLIGSFFSGVLATTVATPCTGPFLGTAVGFAVTLPSLLALSIFTFVGLGMAAPYLALTAYPSLLRFLPKPGAWMVTFKELMGFLMLGSVLWLTWVFGAQTDSLGLFMLLSGFFFIGIACWAYGKWAIATKTKRVRMFGLLCTLLCVSIAGYAIVKASRLDPTHMQSSPYAYSKDWEPFSAERIAELQKKGIPVFVDFTAKWCLICQANHLVLSVHEVEAAFNRLGVVKMKADWTKGDAAITAALKQYGRNSVPLYLLYGPDSTERPRILPQVLTPELVMNHLRDVEQAIAERAVPPVNSR